MSTIDALEMLMEFVSIVHQPGMKGIARYCLFVDFCKAFDSVCRQLLMDKLELRFGINGKLLRLIDSFLHPNSMSVKNFTNGSMPAVCQTIGVQQGDSLSPLLFVLFVDDLLDFLRKKLAGRGVKLIMYADDLCIVTPDAGSMKYALKCLQAWSEVNHLDVNTKKTVIMKVRRGGRLAAADQFCYAGRKLEIVNHFNYLGITFSTTMKVSRHVSSLKLKCAKALAMIKNLGSVSRQTAERVFNIKILPIIRYGISVYGPLLSPADMVELDRIKSQFWKKFLLVPKSSSTSLVHLLAETDRLSVFLHRTNPAWLTQDRYAAYCEKQDTTLCRQESSGPAFHCQYWKSALQKNRYHITGFTVHGFHHLWCRQKTFHKISDTCFCTFCLQICGDKLHALSCPVVLEKAGNTSLSAIHSFLNQSTLTQ